MSPLEICLSPRSERELLGDSEEEGALNPLTTSAEPTETEYRNAIDTDMPATATTDLNPLTDPAKPTEAEYRNATDTDMPVTATPDPTGDRAKDDPEGMIHPHVTPANLTEATQSCDPETSTTDVLMWDPFSDDQAASTTTGPPAPNSNPLFLTVTEDTCWKCGKTGHQRQSCQGPPMLFCSGCGKVGVKSVSCVCRKLFPHAYQPIKKPRDRQAELRQHHCPTCRCLELGSRRRRY